MLVLDRLVHVPDPAVTVALAWREIVRRSRGGGDSRSDGKAGEQESKKEPGTAGEDHLPSL
jgi:hypothetical protein